MFLNRNNYYSTAAPLLFINHVISALTKTSGSDGLETLDVRELEVEVVRQVGPQEEDVDLLFRH